MIHLQDNVTSPPHTRRSLLTMPLLKRAPRVHVCPLCGGQVDRVHRHLGDRVVGLFGSVHRYRCLDAACGWEGIVSGDEVVDAVAIERRAGWVGKALWFLLGIAVAAAAMQGATWWQERNAVKRKAALAAAASVAPAPLPVDVGESYDGDVVPAEDPRAADNRTPLTLRRGCAWGIPGRNPYKGTVGQALTAARLPESAIRKFEALVEKKAVSERLVISRTGIRTVAGTRRFEGRSFDMAFGNTMCFGTRVNFHDGHLEYADLYEATDASGRRYSVMVPDACGNVAVLTDTEERPPPPGQTPEPATWTMLGAGLAAMAWFARRRRTAG